MALSAQAQAILERMLTNDQASILALYPEYDGQYKETGIRQPAHLVIPDATAIPVSDKTVEELCSAGYLEEPDPPMTESLYAHLVLSAKGRRRK